MASNLFNGKIDLGSTPEMFAAFAHFGRLSPGMEFDALHGVLHAVMADCDDVHPDDISKMKRQISAFVAKFGDALDDHEKWILSELVKA